jgi:hypothetical protein
MEITGKKNLGLLKRALLSHITYCSIKSVRSSDKKAKEVYDPEIREAEDLLGAVKINLDRIDKNEIPEER